jgi:hypothetical protein
MANANRIDVGKGIATGFVATIVLSAIMLIKQSIGLMPGLNPIQMITQMDGAETPVVGWVVHFFIETILWGTIFAWLDPSLPGSHWIRGVIFSTGAWLVIMIVIMPMAEPGCSA